VQALLRAMVAALREAREVHPPDSAAMYEAAAKGYLECVELAYADRSVAPNASELRPNPTSAALLKEVACGSLRYGARVEEERKRGGSSADPILAIPSAHTIVAQPTSPPAATGASSPGPSTAPTAVVRLDFSRMLPPPTGEERKVQVKATAVARRAEREAAKYEQTMTTAATVRREEVGGLKTQLLYRVARVFNVSVKRKPGVRGWPEIRAEVLAVWPETCDSVELPAC